MLGYPHLSKTIQVPFLGSMTGHFWPFGGWSIISESIWIYPPSWPQLTTELQWISRKRPLKHRHRWGSPGRSGCCSPECHGVSGHLSMFWRLLSPLLLSKLRWFFSPLAMFYPNATQTSRSEPLIPWPKHMKSSKEWVWKGNLSRQK